MSDLKSLFVLGVIPVLVCLVILSPPCSNAAASQTQAVSALDDAKAAVISAYDAVSKADAAGADVASLLVRLNDAGVVLTRAETAYGLRDYGSVLELAALCQEKLEGLVADADALTNVAVTDSSLDFAVNVVGSIIWSVGIACSGLVVWLFLSRRKHEEDRK